MSTFAFSSSSGIESKQESIRASITLSERELAVTSTLHSPLHWGSRASRKGSGLFSTLLVLFFISEAPG
jgi:hypothetical protein